MAHCGAVTTEIDDDLPVQRPNFLESRIRPSYGVPQIEVKEFSLDSLHAESSCSPAQRNAAFNHGKFRCPMNIVPENPCDRVIRSGRMRKLGKFYKSWKNRFFVLRIQDEELQLSYFKSALHAKPIGDIPLTGKVDVRVIPSDDARRHNPAICDSCFSIETAARRWIFCAENTWVRDMWITAIKRQLMEQSTWGIDYDSKSLTGESDSKGDGLEDLRRRNHVFEIDVWKWHILSQTDNWNEFKTAFKELRLKLEPPNLLNVETMRKVGQPKFSKMCRRMMDFLKHFHGKGRKISGWLWKRGKINTSWKKRFCVVLNDGTFEYMNSPINSSPKRIAREDIRKVSMGLSAEGRQVFHIHTQDRTWNLASVDDETRDLWISALDLMPNRPRRRSDGLETIPPRAARTLRSRSFSSSSSKAGTRSFNFWKQQCEKNMIFVRSDSSLHMLRDMTDSASSGRTYNAALMKRLPSIEQRQLSGSRQSLRSKIITSSTSESLLKVPTQQKKY